MQKDELLSKTISFLRFPLIVGVVFIHFNIIEMGLSAHGISYGADYPGWFYHVVRFFSVVLPSMCVPLFFFFSGYLFFYHTDFNANIYWEKLRKRCHTLLIPFVLWNIIGALMILMYKIPFLQTVLPDGANVKIDLSFERVLNIFFNKDNCILVQPAVPRNTPYPIDAPLWFVRELFVVVILSPAIFYLINKLRGWFILLLGLIWSVLLPIVFPHGSYFVLFGKAVFFFAWGAFYSVKKMNFVVEMQKLRLAPYAFPPLAIADTLTKGMVINTYLHSAVIMVGLLSVVIIAANLIETDKVKVNQLFAKPVFFIFALHGLIIQNIGKMVISFIHLPDNVYIITAFYFSIPIITIAICTFVYILISRYLPPIYRLLTGNR